LIRLVNLSVIIERFLVTVCIVETIFDTLNAKAALYAIGEYLERAQVDIPVFVSGTLVDLSGQSTRVPDLVSPLHGRPMRVGNFSVRPPLGDSSTRTGMRVHDAMEGLTLLHWGVAKTMIQPCNIY
jgi:hypothetical protein